MIPASMSVTNITGRPQGCAPARQILHRLKPGFRMTPRFVWLADPVCLIIRSVILNGLQAVKDLAWVNGEAIMRARNGKLAGRPQGCAPARQILHPAEAGIQDDA